MQSLRKIKSIKIRPEESRWIRELLEINKSNPYLLHNKFDKWYFDFLFKMYPEINSHTYSSLDWSLRMTKYVMETGSEIEAHNEGSEYRLSWNE
jgi:hypothetical protein